MKNVFVSICEWVWVKIRTALVVISRGYTWKDASAIVWHDDWYMDGGEPKRRRDMASNEAKRCQAEAEAAEAYEAEQNAKHKAIEKAQEAIWEQEAVAEEAARLQEQDSDDWESYDREHRELNEYFDEQDAARAEIDLLSSENAPQDNTDGVTFASLQR